jgi:hypothetical protein
MNNSIENITAIVTGLTHRDFVHTEFLTASNIACFLSSTGVSDYIDSKQKVTVKRIKDQVSNQIHAISDGLRTCVANFSTE